MGESMEIKKLQQHLSLLKEEYKKLQQKYNELELKLVATTITTDNDDDNDNTTFPLRLLSIINNLYKSELYSDIKICLKDGQLINGHKLILTAHSPNQWTTALLKDQKQLDWSHIDNDISEAILKWIYKNRIDNNNDNEEFLIKLLKQAHQFNLNDLIDYLEKNIIMDLINLRNCVKFYTIADDLKIEQLRQYCSTLISTYWNDLQSDDFEHMSGPLLYKMLKEKTQFPLHSAVRLQREDVVFLCLVEKSSDCINVWSDNDDLPLDLSLRCHNFSIAKTLLQYNADINIRDKNGDTLLQRYIRFNDNKSIRFLLETNQCDINLTTLDENDTALHLVASTSTTDTDEQIEIVKLLLKKRIDINAQNRSGFTALHIAIQTDNRPIFELLLKQQQLDVNLRTIDEHQPLFYGFLKYESNNADFYISKLIKITNLKIVYKKSLNNNLLQQLIVNNLEQSACYLCDFIDNFNHINDNGETALHLACEYRLANVVEKLLKQQEIKTNLLTNDTNQTPIHYCVKYRSIDCLKIFVKYQQQYNIDFNIRDINGDTPLSLLLNNNNDNNRDDINNELIDLLIKGHADINVRNGRDFTLLHQAILKEDSKTALFLLDYGADINAKTVDSETALHLAIHCRLNDVVEALCIRGVDMSALDRNGNYPLWSALDTNQFDIANILVRYGADTDCWQNGPDNYQQTLLHRAIDENKETIAIFLIQSGCDLDTPRLLNDNIDNGDKLSPLHLCCQWGLIQILRTLIEHRANINARDNENKTPIHIAIENQYDDIIQLLLSVPEIDLTLRDKNGLTPFATALIYRNNRAAELILTKLPTAAEQFDTKGQNFLHTAIKRGDIESVLFLLTVNVDVNSRVQDSTLYTPLHLAAKCGGNETLVRSLILAGARVDDRDAQKRTALHVASEAGNASAVLALLQNNADFDAVDVENNNALHIAVKEGHLNVVRSLLTESTINAEAVNLKGRNPLHELCRYGKDNAAAICELFLECMPEYPINKTDINGNSPLLLAYMNGNSNLCRCLVKANACLGTENHDHITIFNYQVPSKQLLNRLLDQISQPAQWTTTDTCQECGKYFSFTVRSHHCRHCGRALCNKCSDQEVPIIKFGEHKPVRVCRVCFDVLKIGAN